MSMYLTCEVFIINSDIHKFRYYYNAPLSYIQTCDKAISMEQHRAYFKSMVIKDIKEKIARLVKLNKIQLPVKPHRVISTRSYKEISSVFGTKDEFIAIEPPAISCIHYNEHNYSLKAKDVDDSY